MTTNERRINRDNANAVSKLPNRRRIFFFLSCCSVAAATSCRCLVAAFQTSSSTTPSCSARGTDRIAIARQITSFSIGAAAGASAATTSATAPCRCSSFTTKTRLCLTPLGTPPNTSALPPGTRRRLAYTHELQKTKFTIFEPLADLGYFSWNPEISHSHSTIITNGARTTSSGKSKYTPLEKVKDANEITSRIHDLQPPTFLPKEQITVPKKFYHLPSLTYVNKFPYGQLDIACLHVAAKHRGVDLTKVDFVFGGSTLEMLAQKTAGLPYVGGRPRTKKEMMDYHHPPPYFATRIPGFENAVLICKQKEYVQDLGKASFEFERHVTGKSDWNAQQDGVDFFQHMHLMKVGKYTVLFQADIDAIDRHTGTAVEVKMSKPANWGTKVMFQMISNGSTRLCVGESRWEKMKASHRSKTKRSKENRFVLLNRVRSTTLSKISNNALSRLSDGLDMASLERNILMGMDTIQEEMRISVVDDDDDDDHRLDIRRITFDEKKKLKLVPACESTSVLPPKDVVRALLE